ncbi:Hypothetical_protein [Hexamita inflata]|uniref:Hypothetical_protein n=1 Tax=Hexamita inflata TaxID=28002 RepID=A0AA86QKA6_9EUKA|nr:Hypothetical protein HINF_LOCUS48741 [Hexamita inflata]
MLTPLLPTLQKQTNAASSPNLKGQSQQRYEKMKQTQVYKRIGVQDQLKSDYQATKYELEEIQIKYSKTKNNFKEVILQSSGISPKSKQVTPIQKPKVIVRSYREKQDILDIYKMYSAGLSPNQISFAQVLKEMAKDDICCNSVSVQPDSPKNMNILSQQQAPNALTSKSNDNFSVLQILNKIDDQMPQIQELQIQQQTAVVDLPPLDIENQEQQINILLDTCNEEATLPLSQFLQDHEFIFDQFMRICQFDFSISSTLDSEVPVANPASDFVIKAEKEDVIYDHPEQSKQIISIEQEPSEQHVLLESAEHPCIEQNQILSNALTVQQDSQFETPLQNEAYSDQIEAVEESDQQNEKTNQNLETQNKNEEPQIKPEPQIQEPQNPKEEPKEEKEKELKVKELIFEPKTEEIQNQTNEPENDAKTQPEQIENKSPANEQQIAEHINENNEDIQKPTEEKVEPINDTEKDKLTNEPIENQQIEILDEVSKTVENQNSNE